ncbi:hypothetical protein MLD38_007879 [Melastoma candidum]|uniref:Uncharacterized protein n=1 Tax=Melastoma candidum TaxID=119954 RepID=A0ACB9RTV6_9MYRT|nr:hypothetical protein MLD38_007879 [Melastoma candidum]
MSDPSSDDGGRRLYNPYKELNRNFNAKTLNLYSLPTSPEFLFQEESLRRRRSWGENLTFYTGTSYLAGASIGAAYGLTSALRSFERSDTLKLKVNRVLNSSGHAGRKWGNRVGIIGLMYAGAESAIDAVRDADGEDLWSSVGAGLATGVLYRAARGVRSAAVAGAVGGTVAALMTGGKRVLRQYAGV